MSYVATVMGLGPQDLFMQQRVYRYWEICVYTERMSHENVCVCWGRDVKYTSIFEKFSKFWGPLRERLHVCTHR